jgi:hypothetical protein
MTQNNDQSEKLYFSFKNSIYNRGGTIRTRIGFAVLPETLTFLIKTGQLTSFYQLKKFIVISFNELSKTIGYLSQFYQPIFFGHIVLINPYS